MLTAGWSRAIHGVRRGPRRRRGAGLDCNGAGGARRTAGSAWHGSDADARIELGVGPLVRIAGPNLAVATVPDLHDASGVDDTAAEATGRLIASATVVLVVGRGDTDVADGDDGLVFQASLNGQPCRVLLDERRQRDLLDRGDAPLGSTRACDRTDGHEDHAETQDVLDCTHETREDRLFRIRDCLEHMANAPCQSRGCQSPKTTHNLGTPPYPTSIAHLG